MKKLFYSLFMALCATLLFTGCQKDPVITPEFTVTFNTNGGNEVNAVMVEQGSKLAKPTDPTKGEFIFAGWFKDAAWVTPWNFDTDVVTKDVTLYAKWTTVTYTVTFNTDGGSNVEPLTVAKGSKVVQPLSPTKSGAAFDNWYTESAKTTVYDFNTVVNANMTLYAKWITVSQETLGALVGEANQVSRFNYTQESYDAMYVKLEAARQVLQSDPTAQQIITAYTELSAAMSALVALPKKEVAGVYISGVIDGVVFVTPGQMFHLSAYADDATGEPATDNRVIFTYDASKLTEWAGELEWAGEKIQVNDNYLQFFAKSDLLAGETVSVTAKSAENPAISKTITLKVAGVGELRTMFINAVNALPSPDKITYEHYDAITEASRLYHLLVDRDEAVEIAYKKIRECNDAYEHLPRRLTYSFNGNVCTFIALWGSNVEELGEFTFVTDGSFPAGVYTQNNWESDGKYRYYKNKITFKSDGSGVAEYREASDANGKDATPWSEDATFTYTNEGTQAAGGMFFMLIDDENEDELPVVPVKSLSSAKAVAFGHSIFKQLK